MNTHSEILQMPDGSTAFVDGIPDKCQHDDKGDQILWSASGKTIYWHTYRQWAHLPADARHELVYQHHHEIDDPIVGGCVSCSKCKKPFSPPLF